MSAGDVCQLAKVGRTETITGTEGNISMDTTLIQDDVFTVSGSPKVITADEAGLHLIFHSMCTDENSLLGSTRGCGEVFLHINSTLVTGCYADTYIRAASGHNEASDCGFGIYDLSANDEIKLRKLRITGSGGTNLRYGGATPPMLFPRFSNPYDSTLAVVKLNDNDPVCILECIEDDAASLTVDDTDVDMTWSHGTTDHRIDTGFAHTDGTAEVTLDEAGTYLVVYCDPFERATDNSTRTGTQHRLQLDDGGGYADIPGTFSTKYLRGSQVANESILRGNPGAMMLFRTDNANAKIKLTALREAGAITIDRLWAKSRICIIRLDHAQTFLATDTTSENIGSTSVIKLSHDTEKHADNHFTYDTADNSSEVSHTGRYLLMGNTYADDAATAIRSAPFNFLRKNSADVIYGISSSYNRSAGGMQMVSMPWAAISEGVDTDTFKVRNDSLGANATDLAKSGTDCAFAGINLETLAPNPWYLYAQQGGM